MFTFGYFLLSYLNDVYRRGCNAILYGNVISQYTPLLSALSKDAAN